MKRLFLGCLTALLLFACNDPRDLRPVNPCTLSSVGIKVQVRATENVDLLFMIDDSNSMAEEQRALQAQFPRILESLLRGDPDYDPSNPAYVDPDPSNNSPPVKSLRVGVISSDMGVMGVGENPGEPTISTCSAAGNPVKARYGDDGILQFGAHPNSGPDGLWGTADDVSCTAEMGQTFESIPAFLTFPNDAAPALTSADFARRISCFTTLGTAGCGYEQQLESVLKAVAPPDSSIRFYANAADPVRAEGHGGPNGVNGSWFRTNSVLAIVMMTDEDDCSASDRRLFDYLDCTHPDSLNGRCTNPSAPLYTGLQSNTRCQRFPDLVQPVSRYVDGIAALRPDAPESIVFAAITGVPTALVDQVDGSNAAPEEGVSNFDAILSDPAMAATLLNNDIDVAPACDRCPDYNGDHLCNAIEIQRAAPARRIVQVAQGLATRNVGVVVQSICQDSFAGAARAILSKISEAIKSACLPRTLNRNAENLVNCEVLETLPNASLHCSDAEFVDAGRDPSAVRLENGKEVCRIRQLAVTSSVRGTGAAPAGTGWYYDDYTAALATSCGASSQRIAFTDDASPTQGATLRLECLQPITGSGLGVDIDTPCGPGRATLDCGMSTDAYATFQLRYSLPQDYATDYPVFCEYDTNTCQIACVTDADCPGGYACFDDPSDDDSLQGGHPKYCVNAACGTTVHP
ncbi:MAG: hypothetical protein U0230_13240 [Polyangiales bacterium]